MNALDQLIGNLRQRLKQAHRAKRLFADDPALAGQVARAIASVPLLPPDPYGGPQQGGRTARQRVREYFLATGNAWIMVSDLAKACGVTRGGVCQILYGNHGAQFESKAHPRFLRVRLWRLKGVIPPERTATGEEKNLAHQQDSS